MVLTHRGNVDFYHLERPSGPLSREEALACNRAMESRAKFVTHNKPLSRIGGTLSVLLHE